MLLLARSFLGVCAQEAHVGDGARIHHQPRPAPHAGGLRFVTGVLSSS